jgi:hypothetical protein
MSNNCEVRMDSPAGLVIETAITSPSGSCRVDSKDPASHIVQIHNRTLIPYAIMIKSECETPYIRYGHAEEMADSWRAQVFVPPRPDTGGSSQVILSSVLTCTSASINEHIRISVSISPLDSEDTAPAVIDSALLLVETLG